MTPEVYVAMQRAREKFNAELSRDILDALRQKGPATISQIYDRLNGKFTRKQLTETLGLLVSFSRLIGQKSAIGCGTIESPYYLMGVEPTEEPKPTVPSSKIQTLPIETQQPVQGFTTPFEQSLRKGAPDGTK